MLNQQVDCHKCGYSNKLGTICCRNCGTKLKFNKRLLDTHKSKRIKNIFKRIIKSCFVLAVITVVVMAFCPFGFPESPRLSDEKEIALAVIACQEIDTLLDRESEEVDFEFSAAEATFAANYLGSEHEKKQIRRAGGFTSFQPLGGTGKLGAKTKLSGTVKLGTRTELGGTVKGKMKFADSSPAPSASTYVDPDLARRRAWQKAKHEKKMAGQKTEKNPTFDFIINIKDDKTLSLIVKEQWFGFIPCRLELFVIPKLADAAKDKPRSMEYELSAARFGFLPLPLYLKEQILEAFEALLLPERELAKQYLRYIKNIEIKNGKINVSISK